MMTVRSKCWMSRTGGRLKQGEKEHAQSKSSDGEKNKSNGGREEQEQITGQEKGKKVRFGEEEPLEETRAQSTDEPEVTGKIGRGTDRQRKFQAPFEGKKRDVGRTRVAGKAKEKVTKARVSMGMQEDEEVKECDR